ncbi:MAG: hypothetical protein KAF91_23250 [Nostoc sp. TH1S01]|nr:hypothetical protein [Nostoc sp. TH1S01]
MKRIIFGSCFTNLSAVLLFITGMTVNFISLTTTNPAFSASMKKAVCTYSVQNNSGDKVGLVKIDEICKLEQVNKNLIIIHWADSRKNRIEYDSTKNQANVDGQRAFCLDCNSKVQSCLSWDKLSKREEICYKLPTKKPRIIPGTYYKGSSRVISIFSKNSRFCSWSYSINGSTVQSLQAISNDPNTYIPEYYGGFLYAINQNTITWGGADYRTESTTPISPDLKTADPNVKKCLNSKKPFFYRELLPR